MLAGAGVGDARQTVVVTVALVCDGTYAAMAILVRGRRLPSRLRRWGARLPGVMFLVLAGAALLR